MPEIPRYVRFDFLMSLLGVAIFYFSFTNTQINEVPQLKGALILLSSICLLFGIYAMKKNYDEQVDLESLRRTLERKRLEFEIKKIKKPKLK